MDVERAQLDMDYGRSVEKSAHFLLIREDYKLDKLAELHFNEIESRHAIPISIILDRTDGQSERMIQTMEDMLRACVIDLGGNWDSHLPVVEFLSNNNYRTSIKCAPFEALYGRKCRSPLCWLETGDKFFLTRLDVIQETVDKITTIKERLKTARSRQKSYADNHRKPLEFQIGDQVLLKVSSWKGMIRFGKRGKLNPRYTDLSRY
ncbi:putative reverse transcriptase domain-containing protein [Tanacetum coccineum]